MHRMVKLSFLAPTFAFLGSNGPPRRIKNKSLKCHSSVVSPYTTFTTAIATSTTEPESSTDSSLEDLVRLLGVSPLVLIRLESTPDDGVRGVYLNSDVKAGDLIVKVPLQACLLDDEPPQWWSKMKEEQQHRKLIFMSLCCHNPGKNIFE